MNTEDEIQIKLSAMSCVREEIRGFGGGGRKKGTLVMLIKKME